MRAHRAALCVALVAAIVAGCSPFGRGRGAKISTGSVVEEPAPEPAAAAPSLSAFEATELATGLKCTGSFQPLENSATFDAAVVCDNGQTGRVKAARSDDLSGTGALTLADGTAGTVALRRLSTADLQAPPSAKTELPAPDPTAYVR